MTTSLPLQPPNDHHYHGQCSWLLLRGYWRALWPSGIYHRLFCLRRMPYALDNLMEYILSTSTTLRHNASSFKALTSLKPVLWVSLTIYFVRYFFLIKSIRICQNFSAISPDSLYCTGGNHRPRYKWYVIYFFLIFKVIILLNFLRLSCTYFGIRGNPATSS